MAAQWMEERRLVGDLLGYLVVRDEGGQMVCDWDGEIHNAAGGASSLAAARIEEPLYEWFLAEVRRAGDA